MTELTRYFHKKFNDWFYPICPPPSASFAKEHRVWFSDAKEAKPEPYTIEEFERFSNVTYLQFLGFRNVFVKNKLEKQCPRLYTQGAVDKSTKWLHLSYRPQTETGWINDVYIQWINKEVGYGLFARKTISKWEYIGEYTGVVKRINPLNLTPYCYRYPVSPGIYPFNIFAIDAMNLGNETRFMNHSLTPNCETFTTFDGQLFHANLRAIRPIRQGEELTYDYGSDFLREQLSAGVENLALEEAK